VAFGFERKKGSARIYVNVSNPDFEIGQELSRRSYDKYVTSIGRRNPGLATGANAIREAERQLEALRRSLDMRAHALDLRERDLARREAEAAADLERKLFRAERQSAGQRRYRSVLDAWRDEQARHGRQISKRDAARDPGFRQVLADMKGKPNPRGNPNIRLQNEALRERAAKHLGGWRRFKEIYEGMFGPDVRSRPRYGKSRMTRRAA
jgi:hypothetical protein